MAGSYGHNLMSHLSKHNMSVRSESWQNNYSSSIRSILNITGRVPSEQQHIISFSRFIHPFMIEPPCSPVYIYREIASHASEQCGIFGPPATVFGSADVLTSVFKPPCQKWSFSSSRSKINSSPTL